LLINSPLYNIARRVMKWKMDVAAMKMQQNDDVIVDSVTCYSRTTEVMPKI
jgi:hypothetical protein